MKPDGSPLIFVAGDHASIQLKASLQTLLPGVKWTDLGPTTTESVDYPDFAQRLCQSIEANPSALGILICGSGIGMSIAANRYPHIRAALVENPVAARLAREHNHANVLCLGARFLAPEYAAEIIRAWLCAVPSPETKHLQRIQKLGV